MGAVTKVVLQKMKADRLAACRQLSEDYLQITREKLLPSIIDLFDPDVVWVFGSVARRTATEDSDIDLLIVSGPGLDDVPWLKRQQMAMEAVIQARMPFGCDAIVWTRSEWEKEMQGCNGIQQECLRNNEVLYER
ncbi:MAG: nucleotidyltransferase domain-containing protein [Acidithiobacillus ferrooxidans]